MDVIHQRRIDNDYFKLKNRFGIGRSITQFFPSPYSLSVYTSPVTDFQGFAIDSPIQAASIKC